MHKEKRGLGDNQNSVTEEAIKFIDDIYEDLIVHRKHIVQSIMGKNQTIRDRNKRAACNHLNNEILNKFKSWKEDHEKR